MESNNKEYITFNYSDIVYSYYFSDECMCTEMVREHFLCYVYSGEYILEEGKEKRRTIIRPGECVFLRRDNRVNMYKQPKGDDPFMGIFMTFKRPVLRELYQKIGHRDLPQESNKHKRSVIKLPQSPDITSLFQSMIPYFDSSIKPSEEIMTLKLMEGIYSLLNIDKRFYPALFDFTEPWKIDILDYMNENYMYDLSIDDIATFTGRSISTFKRDFKKVCDLSPEKWLIQRRLEAAYDKLQKKGATVSDVYIEVGFKNLSHFSSAFKKQYGVAPSSYNQAL
ncbi:helix-turn-helix domain-containing protein [Dysgonomonas mossii]|uniref:helix-turn-helix domain-containing protein n=1 Tax=Dysgonomonas mossii TaxID=163665 RepID=UPI0039928632